MFGERIDRLSGVQDKTGDEPAGKDPFTGQNLTTKVSYQMTPAYSLHLMVQRDYTVDNASGGGVKGGAGPRMS